MAEAQLFTYHDENSCSVCLDSLTDPVSLHCGHSFCLKCFTNLWDQSQECSCPECGESFTMRPELHINTVLNEDIKKLKMVRLNPHPSQNYAGPGNVECDVCTRKKSRAVMSCLTCAVSYCLTHLQPHFEVAAWKDHKLTDPVRNLKEKFCVKHHKTLEIFCKTDETCICMMCGMTEHDNYEKVKLKTEKKEKQVIRGFLKLKPILVRLATRHDVSDGRLHYYSLYPGTLWKVREKYVYDVQFGALHIIAVDVADSSINIFNLHLTEGNRKVTREGTKANYPDHLNRFDCWPQVLCREALTGTRCYWEVECTGDNLAIGVAYQGLSRKGDGMECSLGNNDKSWSLYCSYSQYSVYHNNKCTILSTPYSPRIGVYLDWPAGSLSFYSVSHTMTLLHRLNTFFTKPLYPGFGVGPDSVGVSTIT
uniref:Tripartite motif-containing protein 16-like n=1 Tax=Erpetoichthys calabaricus TaxID=27687 RepID=A0A8C4XDJ1_ERPCA